MKASPDPAVGFRPFSRLGVDVLAEEPESGTPALVQRLHGALCHLRVGGHDTQKPVERTMSALKSSRTGSRVQLL